MYVRGSDLQEGDTIDVWWAPNVATIVKLVAYKPPPSFPKGEWRIAYFQDGMGMTLEPHMTHKVISRAVPTKLQCAAQHLANVLEGKGHEEARAWLKAYKESK